MKNLIANPWIAALAALSLYMMWKWRKSLPFGLAWIHLQKYLLMSPGGIVPLPKPKWEDAPISTFQGGPTVCLGGNQSEQPENISFAIPPHAPRSATSPECAKEEPAAERVIFENTKRFHEILGTHIGTEFAMYDPQCDEPLDPVSESDMNQMGPSAFLQMLCVQYNVEVTPVPRTEWECERAARKTVRTKIPAWQGERFIQ